MENGRRCYPPSRVEALAVLERNPFDYAVPMSTPVFLPNGNHYIAGFDASATFLEVCGIAFSSARIIRCS